MERWRGKVAVVTGVSAGIGAAIAQKLVEAGLQVVGLDVQKPSDDLLYHKMFSIAYADVTKENEVLSAFDWMKSNFGPVHILINSAGILRKASLIEGDTEVWRQVLDTNVLGVCIATREAIQNMRDNNIDGHIIHLNSILGHSTSNLQSMNIYAATKHAITALTETLRQELNTIASKIKISSISPGMVDTEFYNHYFDCSDGSSKLQKIYPSLTANDVADAVYYILATPAHVQVHELTMHPIGQPL